MTGFTAFLRRLLRKPRKDRWTQKEKDKLEAVAKVKVSVDGSHQFEIKVTYPANKNRDTQLFQLETYIFFPKELEAVDVGFYGHLWEKVRLHTPKATVASLAGLEGPGSLLGSIKRSLEGVRQHASDPELLQAAIRDACTLLRLQACMMRQAMRKAMQKIRAQIADASSLEADVGNRHVLDAAALMINDFVNVSCQALDSFHQVCGASGEGQVPKEVAETWHLCTEWVLVEVERAMLKLVLEIDKLATPSGAGPGPEGWKISVSRAGSTASTTNLAADSASVQGKTYWPTAEDGQPLQRARQVLGKAIQSIQEKRKQCDYLDTMIQPHDARNNELYTHRIKVLKRHAQTAVSLVLRVQQPSQMLVDLVGGTIAGFSMCIACFSIWIAFRYTRDTINMVYIVIIVVGYVIKDRTKEWGKRYLVPVASWFGYDFPQRILHVVDEQGRTVGLCKETARVKDDSQVDKHVLRSRWRGGTRGQASMPERVLHFSKSMRVHWDQLDARLTGVGGLVDIMRFDVLHFCRRMEPPTEPHFYMSPGEGGRFTVEKLKCARNYHLNVVVRIRSADASGDKNASVDKNMQLDHACLVLNQEGIIRLEPQGSELLAKRSQPSFPLLRLSAMKQFRAVERGALTSADDSVQKEVSLLPTSVRHDEETGL